MQRILDAQLESVETPEGFGTLSGFITEDGAILKALVRFEGETWPGDLKHKVITVVAFDMEQVRLASGRNPTEIDEISNP